MFKDKDLYKFLVTESNNVQTSHIKWIRLLTNDDPVEIDRFKKYLELSKGKTGSAIVKYRDYLYRETCRGKIELTDLIESFELKKYDGIRRLLQELFLQYIDDATLKYIIEKLHSKISIEKLYSLHMRQTRKCIEKLI